MDKTNANNFRNSMKDWMEAARKEPVKITRKSGEAFVLVNADEFEKMQLELANLRGVAKGLTDVIQGRTSPASNDSTHKAIERAKERVLGKRATKAVG